MATPKQWDWTNGHVQRETGTDSPHVQRTVVFRDHQREYKIDFQIPAHIYRQLSDGDRERARLECDDLFRKMLLVAKISKVRNAEQVCLEEALRTYLDRLYRTFVSLQWNAGNKKWLVPRSIQSNVLEEN